MTVRVPAPYFYSFISFSIIIWRENILSKIIKTTLDKATVAYHKEGIRYFTFTKCDTLALEDIKGVGDLIPLFQQRAQKQCALLDGIPFQWWPGTKHCFLANISQKPSLKANKQTKKENFPQNKTAQDEEI